jgi:hypothetical protein
MDGTVKNIYYKKFRLIDEKKLTNSENTNSNNFNSNNKTPKNIDNNNHQNNTPELKESGSLSSLYYKPALAAEVLIFLNTVIEK